MLIFLSSRGEAVRQTKRKGWALAGKGVHFCHRRERRKDGSEAELPANLPLSSVSYNPGVSLNHQAKESEADH